MAGEVADTDRRLREREARVEEVARGVPAERGFEEVVVHLGGAAGPVDLPPATVADHAPDMRIEEIRVYLSTRPLTGRATERPPLVEGDPELRLPSPATAYVAEEGRQGVELEPCVLVDDGETCALDYIARRPGSEAPTQAGLTVLVRDADGGLAASRTYDDVDRRVAKR